MGSGTMIDLEDELEHSERGPSTAHRWRLCPASVQASRGLPDNAGIFAAEGTAFHSFAADALEFGLRAEHLIGMTHAVEGFGTFTMDNTMANHMQPGLDLFSCYTDLPGSITHVETRVSLANWIGPKEFGTTDASCIDVVNHRLITLDWKYGAGVPVSPEDNDQGMLYTLGIWDAYGAEALKGLDPDEIEVHIIIEQPRAPGGGGLWETTMGHLLREGKKIRRDAERTEDPNAPFNPGPKQCKFCKAAYYNTCKARIEYMARVIGTQYDQIEAMAAEDVKAELASLRVLSPEARSLLIRNRAMIEGFLKQLHDEAMQDLEAGKPAPGLKRILGRAGRTSWTDERKAAIILERYLFDRAYQKKVLSPSQARDELGRSFFEEKIAAFATPGSKAPILVPEEHKGEALSSIHDTFDAAMAANEDDTLI